VNGQGGNKLDLSGEAGLDLGRHFLEERQLWHGTDVIGRWWWWWWCGIVQWWDPVDEGIRMDLAKLLGCVSQASIAPAFEKGSRKEGELCH
jgi:hypothetical protein